MTNQKTSAFLLFLVAGLHYHRKSKQSQTQHLLATKHTKMPKANEPTKLVKSTKLTEGEKKKQKQENKAKANPEKAAAKKVKADAKRERRYVVHRTPPIINEGSLIGQ